MKLAYAGLLFAAGLLSGQVLVNGSQTVVGTVNACQDAGASDTYACNLTPALPAYTTGACYTFKANTANTGAASLNINSLGAKTIKKSATSDLADNDIRAGQWVSVCYDGTNLQLQSVAASLLGFSTVTFSATQTVDTAACSVCQITMTGNITNFNFTNLSTTRPEFAVVFVQDGTGNRTLSGVSGAIIGMCEIVLTASKRTAVKFYYDGTNSYASLCVAPDTASNIINVNGFDYTLPGVDATLQSAAQDQAALDRSCISSTGSDTYTCGLTPALGAYTNGMQTLFRPTAAACTGPASINIDSLGAKNLYLADGTGDPACAEDRDYWITYDTALNGAAGGWKMPGAAGGSGATIDGAFLSSGGNCYLPSLDLMQATIPSGTSYTQINSGATATITTIGGGACTYRRYAVTGDGSDAPINSGEFISIGANTSHVAAISCDVLNFRGLTDGSLATFQNTSCYVGLRESGTQKRLGVGITARAVAGFINDFGINITRYTDDDLYVTTPVPTYYTGSGGTKFLVRLRVDGTRAFIDYSENGGSTWREIYRELYTVLFTTAPDQFGEWAQPPDLSTHSSSMFIYSRSTQ